MTAFRNDLEAALARVHQLEQANKALKEQLAQARRAEQVLDRYVDLEDPERCIPHLETIAEEVSTPGIEGQHLERLLMQTERWDRLVALYERRAAALTDATEREELHQRIVELRLLL